MAQMNNKFGIMLAMSRMELNGKNIATPKARVMIL